jgi:hypothetical protein
VHVHVHVYVHVHVEGSVRYLSTYF